MMQTPTAGYSTNVSSGDTFFGLIGMYTIPSITFLFLVYREFEHGPAPAGHPISCSFSSELVYTTPARR